MSCPDATSVAKIKKIAQPHEAGNPKKEKKIKQTFGVIKKMINFAPHYPL